jgi:hypothetical protein
MHDVVGHLGIHYVEIPPGGGVYIFNAKIVDCMAAWLY